MGERTLIEWIAWYEKKTGEKFHVRPSFNVEFHPEKGFMLWKKERQTFLIDQIGSADINYWADFVKSKSTELGCKFARTIGKKV